MHHFGNHFAESIFWFPAKFVLCFCRITNQNINFSRAEIDGIDCYNCFAWRHLETAVATGIDHSFFIDTVSDELEFEMT